mmetsp:Transcript_27875/g.43263  ORF Transcript_27875/g.43263 Transcript_27875/m.43263 type:complete len:84 (+) Transcript_27875:173-424(+)
MKPTMFQLRKMILKLFLCVTLCLVFSKCIFVGAQEQVRGHAENRLKETKHDPDVIKTPKNKKKDRPPKRRKQKPRKEDRDHEL